MSILSENDGGSVQTTVKNEPSQSSLLHSQMSGIPEIKVSEFKSNSVRRRSVISETYRWQPFLKQIVVELNYPKVYLPKMSDYVTQVIEPPLGSYSPDGKLFLQSESVKPRIYDKKLLDNVQGEGHREVIRGMLKDIVSPPAEEEPEAEEPEEEVEGTEKDEGSLQVVSSNEGSLKQEIRGF